MKSFPDTFAIIDTETTGMRPPFSRIIDIGIIRVEKGKEVERFQSLLNPGVAIPYAIQRLTSITNEDLERAPQFEDIALQVEALLKGAVFVAHNAPFDYSFVKSEFARLGMEFSAETLCSVRFSRALTPRDRSHSLDAVIDRYNLQVKGDRHRALPDAVAVWDFFQKANEEHTNEDISRALSRARTATITPRVAKDTFTDLPDGAGVYFFYGPEQELLYIGKSKHLRTRARSHFHSTSNRKEVRLQEETSMVSSVKTSGELSALLLESTLIKQESPLYNRALRKRKALVLAESVLNEQGYKTLILTRTGEIDPTKGKLAIFRTVAQAKVTLRELAKEQKLCAKLLGIEAGAGSCFAYQLHGCTGACLGPKGKETAEAYNERFDAAFAARSLRAWPYRGTVMIEEKDTDSVGTVLFIRDWILLGAYRYDGETYEPLLPSNDSRPSFEYDTYKILVRYLLHPRNKKTIKALAPAEYEAALLRCTGAYEEAVEYDEVLID